MTAVTLARLVRSVAILALPADDQVAWLRSLGLGEPGLADEVALEFGDAHLLTDRLLLEGHITAAAANALNDLDRQLTLMSGPERARFWSIDALRSLEEWHQVRGLARAALFEMP